MRRREQLKAVSGDGWSGTPSVFSQRKTLQAWTSLFHDQNEALTLITAVLACSVYFGSNPVIVISDHSPLQFINSMANTNQKLLRWKLELQQYTLEIRHRPGGLNFLPDFLSRPAWVWSMPAGVDPCWVVVFYFWVFTLLVRLVCWICESRPLGSTVGMDIHYFVLV